MQIISASTGSLPGGRRISDAEQEAIMLRQAIIDADWDTVERHGGLDSVVDKIDQTEEETATSAGAGRINDFRLWGSRRWRRMGEYSTETKLYTWMVQTLDNHDASLSEGRALAVLVRDFPGTPHHMRDNTDFPRLMRQSKARLLLARPSGRLKALTRAVLLNLVLTTVGLRASGSGPTTPCDATGSLSTVGVICPCNQGQYTRFPSRRQQFAMLLRLLLDHGARIGDIGAPQCLLSRYILQSAG